MRLPVDSFPLNSTERRAASSYGSWFGVLERSCGCRCYMEDNLGRTAFGFAAEMGLYDAYPNPFGKAQEGGVTSAYCWSNHPRLRLCWRKRLCLKYVLQVSRSLQPPKVPTKMTPSSSSTQRWGTEWWIQQCSIWVPVQCSEITNCPVQSSARRCSHECWDPFMGPTAPQSISCLHPKSNENKWNVFILLNHANCKWY